MSSRKTAQLAGRLGSETPQSRIENFTAANAIARIARARRRAAEQASRANVVAPLRDATSTVSSFNLTACASGCRNHGFQEQ
jgi:hypothetical protein